MLRSIGSVTFLALLMVGCGGGGGGGGGGSLATYSIGGTVTGLSGSGLVLQTNAGDVAPVSAPGAFTFTNQLGSGAAYRVFVQTQPSSPAQNCVVTNGTGFVGTANVATVAVACSTATGYTVGGTVSGLVGSGLTLAICRLHGIPGGHGEYCDWGSPLQVRANGAFTLGADFPTGYSGDDRVVVTQQPSSPMQRCVVGNAAINTQNVNDTSVTVSCAEYSYVTNAADNTVSAYTLDATTGALAAIGTPIATGGTSPYAIVGTPEKSLVFVANEGSNDVSAFTVNPTTGALTEVPGSPFAVGTNPQAMAVIDAGGGPEFLLVANAGSDNISAYNIDGGGALTFGASAATGKGPTSIAVHPNGGWIYVANHGGSNDISVFPLSSGETVPGSPFPAGGNPLSLAFGAGGMFLYTANPDATHPSISGFSVDPAGALAPLSGSPFPLPVSHYMATDQNGSYLYVTSGANIVGYAIDWITGALTALPGFPVAAGADAYSVSIDPTNQFLYVANDGAANIAAFRLDASTGALTPMASSPFPAGNHPEFIATL